MSPIDLLLVLLRALAVAFLAPTLVGAGITKLVPGLRRAAPSVPQQFYVGFLGGGMAGLLLYGAGAPKVVVIAVLGLVALVGAPGLFAQVRRTRWNRFALVLGGLLVPLLISGAIFCCWDLVTGEDATALWLARLRVLQAWLPASELNDFGIAHPGYPFLGSFWWWLVTTLAVVPVEVGRVVFLVAYLLFFVELAQAPRSQRTLPFALVVAMLAYAFYREEWIGGYQDGPVMIFFAWSALILCRAQQPEHALAFMPFFACLAGIKTEGAVLAMILVASWAVFRVRALLGAKLRRRTLLTGVAFGVIPLLWPLLLRLKGAQNTSVQGGTFSGVTAQWLVEQAWRVPEIVRRLATGLDPAFVIVVAACVAGVVRSATRRRSAVPRWLVLAIALHSLFLIVVFWSTHAPFEWHMMTALDRLRAQGELLWVVLLVSVVEHNLEEPPDRKETSDSKASNGVQRVPH